MLRSAVEKLARFLEPQWPRPRYGLNEEPILLLLLTLPFSGSTAMAKFIQQAEGVGTIEEISEGQRIVKGMFASDRWRPEKICDYESIKCCWFSAIEEQIRDDKTIEYVIEKSPPNMVRHRHIIGLFRQGRVVVNNRNPYAWVSSSVHKRIDFSSLQETDRKQLIEKRTGIWLEKSALLRTICQTDGVPLLTYEKFCERPARILESFSLHRDLVRFDPDYAVSVKNYDRQPITNMNARQVSELSNDELEAIRTRLEPHFGLLDFFGYNTDWRI